MNQRELSLAIQAIVKARMQDVMHKALIEMPYSERSYFATHPLEVVLVPNDVFKSAHFSRLLAESFSKIWKFLAQTVAEKSLGLAATEQRITGTIKAGRLKRIAAVLSQLEYPEKGPLPNWKEELSYVLAGKGEPIPVTVVCDVYAEDRDRNQRYAFELKAPLPNSDITKVSKEKILKLYSMEPRQIDGAYYALPYNPYGRREDYAWSFPARWFNMREDEVVLIGDEFWEKIGGPGTYQAFISAINEIGPAYRDRIYREFLQIEPPAQADDVKL